MKLTPWREIRAKKFSPARRAKLDREVQEMLLEMDLREIRRVAGKTQAQIAKALKKAQGEISRMEHRDDHLLSTLEKYVAAWRQPRGYRKVRESQRAAAGVLIFS